MNFMFLIFIFFSFKASADNCLIEQVWGHGEDVVKYSKTIKDSDHFYNSMGCYIKNQHTNFPELSLPQLGPNGDWMSGLSPYYNGGLTPIFAKEVKNIQFSYQNNKDEQLERKVDSLNRLAMLCFIYDSFTEENLGFTHSMDKSRFATQAERKVIIQKFNNFVHFLNEGSSYKNDLPYYCNKLKLGKEDWNEKGSEYSELDVINNYFENMKDFSKTNFKLKLMNGKTIKISVESYLKSLIQLVNASSFLRLAEHQRMSSILKARDLIKSGSCKEVRLKFKCRYNYHNGMSEDEISDWEKSVKLEWDRRLKIGSFGGRIGPILKDGIKDYSGNDIYYKTKTCAHGQEVSGTTPEIMSIPQKCSEEFIINKSVLNDIETSDCALKMQEISKRITTQQASPEEKSTKQVTKE